MPTAPDLKIRLLLKEASDRMQIAAKIAEDSHAAAKLAELARAIEGLRAHMAAEASYQTVRIGNHR